MHMLPTKFISNWVIHKDNTSQKMFNRSFNPLRFMEQNIYSRFIMSFLHIDMAHVVDTLPQDKSLPILHRQYRRVLKSWRRKEPGQQQPWYILCWTELIGSSHLKG